MSNFEERGNTAVVELPENRDVPATPETIEALVRDAGDPDPRSEPQLFQAALEFLQGQREQFIRQGGPAPTLWEMDMMLLGFANGHRTALQPTPR